MIVLCSVFVRLWRGRSWGEWPCKILRWFALMSLMEWVVCLCLWCQAVMVPLLCVCVCVCKHVVALLDFKNVTARWRVSQTHFSVLYVCHHCRLSRCLMQRCWICTGFPFQDDIPTRACLIYIHMIVCFAPLFLSYRLHSASLNQLLQLPMALQQATTCCTRVRTTFTLRTTSTIRRRASGCSVIMRRISRSPWRRCTKTLARWVHGCLAAARRAAYRWQVDYTTRVHMFTTVGTAMFSFLCALLASALLPSLVALGVDPILFPILVMFCLCSGPCKQDSHSGESPSLAASATCICASLSVSGV